MKPMDVYVRIVALVGFFIIVMLDDGMGMAVHSIDIKIKGALLGYALVGDRILNVIPGYKDKDNK